MSRGAAAACRAVFSSAASPWHHLFRCCGSEGALKALLRPEGEPRAVRWLAASASSMSDRTLPSTTLPRRIAASRSTLTHFSIHGWKLNSRGFATEPVGSAETGEKKVKQSDKDDRGDNSTSSTSSTSSSPSTTWASAGWSWDACATLPNAISAARALSAPFLFQAITHGRWGVAGSLLVFGAVSDWADGASARLLDRNRKRKEIIMSSSSTSSSPSSPPSSSSSPLGTYLDPLADKIFIGAAVAAAAGWGGGDGGGGFLELEAGGGGEEAAAAVVVEDENSTSSSPSSQTPAPPLHRWPLLPSSLATAIIGRDVFLVGGSLFARLRQFEGGRWPGGPEFFRLVDGKEDDKAKKNETTTKPSPAASAAAAPRIRPLFVSKLNTALQFATVGAAVADSGGWLEGGIRELRAATAGGGGEVSVTAAASAAASLLSDLSGSDVVKGLAAATAAMTAVSGWAYASAYLKGKKRWES